jgi:two-component system sensor histidine kinase YesM
MTAEQLASVKEQLAGTPSPASGDTENRIYGLYNVAKRLELYYNRTDLLNIQSTYREGTQVTLLIPESVVEVVQSPATVNPPTERIEGMNV